LKVPQYAPRSVLPEARRATTGDLLNIAKRYSSGRTWSNFHVTAAHAAILGADLAPQIAPTRAVTRRFSVRNYPSDLGGAKRARTADLLHAMNHQHGYGRRYTLRQPRKR
jgi:hypothetical protein